MVEKRKRLPGTASHAITKKSAKNAGFLDKVRSANAKAPSLASTDATTRGDPALIAQALAPARDRPRLVFAIDATASREPAWQAAKATTDALFHALPGQLDIALAVHSGSRLTAFTDFASDPAPLRQAASLLQCEAGITRLLDILERTRDASAKVLIYIGDVFEEDLQRAEHLATSLRLRGTRVIIFHDRAQAPSLDVSAEAFHMIARITQGAVLPFDHTATAALRDALEAIATLAVGGVKLLQQRAPALPAATMLLHLLADASR